MVKKSLSRRGLSQIGFNIDDNIHAVAYQALVCRDAEIAPIQSERGLPAGDRGPFHAWTKAQRCDLEHDFFRHVLHRKHTRDGVSVSTGAFPRLSLEPVALPGRRPRRLSRGVSAGLSQPARVSVRLQLPYLALSDCDEHLSGPVEETKSSPGGTLGG